MEPDEAMKMNADLSGRIMGGIQDAIAAGEFGEAELVVSHYTVIEALDSDGNSRLSVIRSDDRLTVSLGLAAYGNLFLHSGG